MVLPNEWLGLINLMRVIVSVIRSHFDHFAQLVGLEAICRNYKAIRNWLANVDATEKNDSDAKASGF